MPSTSNLWNMHRSLQAVRTKKKQDTYEKEGSQRQQQNEYDDSHKCSSRKLTKCQKGAERYNRIPTTKAKEATSLVYCKKYWKQFKMEQQQIKTFDQ